MEYSLGSAGPIFCPFGEANTGERWKVWLRNFEYYVGGQVGLNDKQKISRLLHQAGPEVQEIYETIEEQNAEGSNEFEKCKYRLTNYFQPEVNTAYERQKFRNISMNEKENVNEFVLRLRKQAKYCEFSNTDEVVRDQLIEKCVNKDLKRKFLKKGKDLTLTRALELARLFELDNLMFSSEEKEEKVKQEETSVNKVHQGQSFISCYRCGRRGHIAKDSKCPAAAEQCDKCGIKGHFAKCCKTKSSERKKEVKKKKKRYVKYVVSHDSDSESTNESDNSDCEDSKQVQVNSVFTINSMDNKCKIKVGERYMCDFIIDSGASINIIDKHTFKRLTNSGFSCELKDKNNDRYFAYGGEEIKQVGIFSTLLYSPDSKRKVNANILVFKGCGPSLLSKQTSIDLGLLRVGPISVELPKIYSINPIDSKNAIMKEYPKLFDGIGKLKNFKLTIPIDRTVKLIAQPVRRQPFNLRHIEKGLITELIENDIVEPVTGPTPCVSPSHIVKKKEKDQYRLVIDMRKANEAVMRERVPLPTFEELLADLNGCKFFSTLDLKSGYHQLELDEDSRNITVFSSSLGLFRYKRLFFGVRCASEMFQRVIAHLLQGIEGVANSQDDIRIGGRTREEHDARLREVLDRLNANGLTLNERKCRFGESEIVFLGHHISAAGVRPTTTNQQVVQEFRAPQNTAEVRSFLGLANFSARFIPDFSTIAAPLRKLTKKDTEFKWIAEHQEAFQKLKTLIASAPALGFYNRDSETTLVTDASPVGIAAVLIQKQIVKGEEQPIIIKYISKALTPTEQRYSQTEKEALAIVWACETLYMYLIGKQFNIISDHKPLEIIYSPNSKPSARIQRWVLRLQPFTFKVIYKPGKNNIADPISRLLDTSNPLTKNTEDCEDRSLLALVESSMKAVTLEEVQEATMKDEELCDLKKAIEKDIWPKEFRKYELIKTELCVIDNIILRGTRIVIPTCLKERILDLGHEGHIGTNSMKAKLRLKVWWKGMDKDVEYWVDTCDGCRLVRQDTHPEPITSTKLPSKVWELVGIDYMGPLPSGHYLLVVVDYYSRYFEVEILKNQTAETTIKTLEEIICREGLMDEIVCDNGPAFRDERFKEFLVSNGVRLRHTTPLWPQANGEVERQNRNILRRLRIAQAKKLDWKKELQVYLSAYRTSPHSTTGLPPGDVFRGRKIKTKLPEMKVEFNLNDEQIRDNDRYKKYVQKEYADRKRHAGKVELHPGDKVLMKQRKEDKLSTPFSPVEHTVVWKSGNSVTVQSPNGKVIKRNSLHFKPIKYRDGEKFVKEKEEIRNGNKDLEEVRGNEPDATKEEGDLTHLTHSNRPHREKRLPPKYNDFLLSLIVDSLN
ncbi:uncharacterized protein K02A2.6-like [Plodia interpunctella]|uniref:uncharacterized protein K02A2.6-like n=1 Tax=Plodia interpunctella TaxID=58824 RepID=UPI002368BE5B|nr:uncharacterized protein K02A2.6-like [Plodia interpunctella]